MSHYICKLCEEQENSTSCAIIYYAVLLFGPERCLFAVEITIYGTGINNIRYIAVKKIKKLAQKILLILEGKAGIW